MAENAGVIHGVQRKSGLANRDQVYFTGLKWSHSGAAAISFTRALVDKIFDDAKSQ